MSGLPESRSRSRPRDPGAPRAARVADPLLPGDERRRLSRLSPHQESEPPRAASPACSRARPRPRRRAGAASAPEPGRPLGPSPGRPGRLSAQAGGAGGSWSRVSGGCSSATPGPRAATRQQRRSKRRPPAGPTPAGERRSRAIPAPAASRGACLGSGFEPPNPAGGHVPSGFPARLRGPPCACASAGVSGETSRPRPPPAPPAGSAPSARQGQPREKPRLSGEAGRRV